MSQNTKKVKVGQRRFDRRSTAFQSGPKVGRTSGQTQSNVGWIRGARARHVFESRPRMRVGCRTGRVTRSKTREPLDF